MTETQNIEWKESWRDEYMKADVRYDGVNRIEDTHFLRMPYEKHCTMLLPIKTIAVVRPFKSVSMKICMFWNDGQLPENWTIDRLFQKHPFQPYNPNVANAFFRAGLIESWGRGVDVMVQACRKYGSPEPVLRYEDSGFWVEFGAKVVTGK
jgi:ATP-dependent DNA helicase RecG